MTDGDLNTSPDIDNSPPQAAPWEDGLLEDGLLQEGPAVPGQLEGHHSEEGGLDSAPVAASTPEAYPETSPDVVVAEPAVPVETTDDDPPDEDPVWENVAAGISSKAAMIRARMDVSLGEPIQGINARRLSRFPALPECRFPPSTEPLACRSPSIGPGTPGAASPLPAVPAR